MSTGVEVRSPLEMLYKWEQEKPEVRYMRQPIEGEWIEYNWARVADEVRRMAAWLQAKGYEPGSKVAILSKNCVHWVLADWAIWMAGYVSVPIYPNVTPQTLQQILEHSESKLCFVGKLDEWSYLRPGVPAGMERVAFPFYGIDEFPNWDEVLQGIEPMKENVVPPMDNICTIMYTSGTTGVPKGVMHSFFNFAYAASNALPPLHIGEEATFFSYLPMCHIAERLLIEMGSLYAGGQVSFAESLETFPRNLADTQPTVFLAVPRIWAKFQEKILEKMPQKRLDLLLAIPLVNGLIRSKIKKTLGLANATNIFSGAAPISVELINWFGRLGIQIQQAYAMTEDSCYSHVNIKWRDKVGTVGEALPDVNVRISEEGEIQIKHEALMKGYFKEPGMTAEVFTDDGYFRTGDKGERDGEGYLRITGRVKDLFKTSKGKYVAPGPIEMKLMDDPDVEQACVVGLGLPQPIALVTLSEAGRNKTERDLEHSLRATLFHINEGLDSFEKMQKAIIITDEWTIDNGLMTPTMKIKRGDVEKKYQLNYEKWYGSDGDILWEEVES